MNNIDRKANADKFLELIKKSRRGHFKVYLGMAAGVGKTYRMLQDARNMLSQGIDLMIGLIEFHGREETRKLAEGIPSVPQKKVFYKGREFEEMDVDAVLRRHPEVVLVDELAHSNLPGCKYEKRYQDVEEILKAGINVVSTLNIQHLESLNVIVEDVTGIKVAERMPDNILKMADEVVNVDLTVDELLTRLLEGKIYDKSKISQALENFFKKENLLQLRELALREVASLVERKIDNEIEPSQQKSNEKLLACISTNDEAARIVIHKSARIASKMNTDWYVLYIQTENESAGKINLAVQRHLINNMKLATQLGAKVVKQKDNDVASAILKFAIDKGLNRIIIGRAKKRNFKNFFLPGILNKLIRISGNHGIDINIVS
jgi:two-component system, OmpR family, sensor histidine kinase KdpD